MVYSFSAWIDFRRQNLTSIDVILWRLKSVSALAGLTEFYVLLLNCICLIIIFRKRKSNWLPVIMRSEASFDFLTTMAKTRWWSSPLKLISNFSQFVVSNSLWSLENKYILRLAYHYCIIRYNLLELRAVYPSKHETLNQCWLNVGPAS